MVFTKFLSHSSEASALIYDRDNFAIPIVSLASMNFFIAILESFQTVQNNTLVDTDRRILALSFVYPSIYVLL